MTMKKFKTRDHDDVEDRYDPRRERRRRQVKNWTKAWKNGADEYEEIDDFHAK